DTSISIASSVKDPMKEEAEAVEELRVYSDRSAFKGGVGEAAVLMRGNERIAEHCFYLGSTEEHTVYKAEAVGMILGVELLKEAGGRGTMALGVDNQAAIRAMDAFSSKPGHYLIDIFHDDLHRLLPSNDGRKLMIRWMPGHEGIAGN
ncbi:hypothetical protein BDR04DRAFT_1035080, partial [Suillus decipiens]